MTDDPRGNPEISFSASTTQQVYDWLRSGIVRAEFPPGSRLSESAIASRLQISRQPVREAFIRLSVDGLIDVRPQRGTYISRISIAAVLAARFIRSAVESDIVRLVAAKATPETRAELDDHIALQRQAVLENDTSRFFELDNAFHQLLAIKAGQETSWQALKATRSQLNRLRYISVRSFDFNNLLRQHESIVTAIKAGDQEQAEKNLRTHLEEVFSDLPDLQGKFPDYFRE